MAQWSVDDCPCSEIPSEPNSAFSYPGGGVVSSQAPLQKDATQNQSSLLHGLFFPIHISPLNFTEVPKHRPKTRLIRKETGQASAGVGFASAPIRFHSYLQQPQMGRSRTPPSCPTEAGVLPSRTHMAGIEAMVQDLMWTCELITWAKGEHFDRCLHFKYIRPGEFSTSHLFVLHLGTSF